MAKTKQLETVISESDEEDEIKTKDNNNSSNPEEREEEKDNNNINNQKQPMTRRGERARKKPEYFGHNIMVSQLSPTEETEPEKN